MAAYYNEFDPFAAAWLRELIKAGMIPDGDVDERDIREVQPEYLRGYTQCHFFAGIGGWAYALRLAGWPDERPVWTGSPPCQPFSVAGNGLGKRDERHLAPVWLELVQAVRPHVLFGEQVAAAVTKDAWLDDLLDALEGAGYATGAAVTPACGVGAPHIRQRLWFTAQMLADTLPAGRAERWAEPGRGQAAGGCNDGGLARSDSAGQQPGCREGCGCESSEARHDAWRCGSAGRPGPVDGFWSDCDWLYCRDGKWRPVESAIRGIPDGIPSELVQSGAFVPASSPLSPSSKDSRRVMRLKGYGNAIVPQVASEIIMAFMEAIDGNHTE